MVMTLEESKVFLQNHPELYVMLLYTDAENQMQQYVTGNFKKLIIE
jgi:thiamine biosynthesis lipoprotein